MNKLRDSILVGRLIWRGVKVALAAFVSSRMITSLAALQGTQVSQFLVPPPPCHDKDVSGTSLLGGSAEHDELKPCYTGQLHCVAAAVKYASV